MREGLLFPGVVLTVLMILFAFAPLPNAPSGQVSSARALTVKPPAFPYSEETPISVSWNGGNASTFLEIIPCLDSNCSAGPKAPVTAPLTVNGGAVVANGSSGGFTVWVSTTLSLLIVTNSLAPLSVTVTWNEMPEFGLLWEILTVVGILLTIGGMVLPEHGAPRGHHRRLSYAHWRHHAFALPPHLPSTGLTCSACGLSDIPHEDDFCPRCQAPLPRASTVVPGPPSTAAAAPASPARPRGAEMAAGTAAAASAAGTVAAVPPKKRVAVNKSKVAGQSLSVADPDPLRPWRVMKGLGFAPEEAVVFTREDPVVLEEKYHLTAQQVHIISRTEGEGTISPSECDKIADLADQHLRSHAGGVVVLTDPNYFVTHGGFDVLRRLVLAIQDHAREQRGTFILAFNPSVFTPDQRAQLEERMRKVV
ncbi:MAG: DUF835 domain-containing protein [Euryarchaeota archaeon]|nr:DUF835 domain-containing protein [Euryarchaeota archaeon]MDE1835591.1 DUF835 domain-containing protein [Euryarchaeota archaeon]MDE1878939.1 DUF835 domain-containing protein [Euryarchaeota archaeon]MDE2043787.1 DUF835 domain-containing protein [Thermoplasmata archaeon]